MTMQASDFGGFCSIRPVFPETGGEKGSRFLQLSALYFSITYAFICTVVWVLMCSKDFEPRYKLGRN